MKSFDDIKKDRILSEHNRLNVAKKRLNVPGGIAKSIRQKEQIDYSLSVLDNIDETVRMEISYNANLLFEFIYSETQYTIFTKMFYSRMLEYIRFIENGESVNGNFNFEVIHLIKYFDFNISDILKLVEFDSEDTLKDGFSKFINDFYGTNIPLLSEWVVMDENDRLLCTEEELKNYDISEICLQFKNGDFMINRFNSMYPMLYKKDMIQYFGEEYFNENTDKCLRRNL